MSPRKRILLLALLALASLPLLLVLGLWVAFGRTTQDDPLAAKQVRDEARQRFEDLQRTPPDQNSAVLLRPLLLSRFDEGTPGPVDGPRGRVVKEDLKALSDYLAADSPAENRALLARDPVASAQAVEAWTPVLALLDEALERPRFVWPGRWEDQLTAPLPDYLAMRNLTKGLAVCALQAELQGRDGKALDLLMKGLAWAGQVAGQGPLIQEMIALAEASIAVEPLLELESSGRLKAPDYRKALAALGDLPFQREGLVRAMDREYAAGCDAMRTMPGQALGSLDPGSAPAPPVRLPEFIWRPILERESNLFTNHYLAQRPYLADLRDLPAADPTLEKTKKALDTTLVAQILAVNAIKAQAQYRRVLTDLEAARVLAALQLHRLEKGTWPASLDALVPAYLPAPPVAWVSPDRKFHYAAEGKSMTLAVTAPLLRDPLSYESDTRSYHPYRPLVHKAGFAPVRSPVPGGSPPSPAAASGSP